MSTLAEGQPISVDGSVLFSSNGRELTLQEILRTAHPEPKILDYEKDEQGRVRLLVTIPHNYPWATDEEADCTGTVSAILVQNRTQFEDITPCGKCGREVRINAIILQICLGILNHELSPAH